MSPKGEKPEKMAATKLGAREETKVIEAPTDEVTPDDILGIQTTSGMVLSHEYLD